MKYFIIFITSTLRMAAIGFALSAVFTLGQWLLSLISVCEAPTWGKFLWGGLGLFAIMFVYASYKAISGAIKFKRIKNKTQSLTDRLQNLAQKDPYTFIELIDNSPIWEMSLFETNDAVWFEIHPLPVTEPMAVYYVRVTDEHTPLDMAVTELENEANIINEQKRLEALRK